MSDNKVNEQEVERADVGFKVRLKNYLFQWLKSPFLIIGTVLVTFTILVALFPQILTRFTLEETLDFYPNPEYPDQLPWMDPSKDHPLGTTKFGRDLLAVISWATRDTLIIGFGAVLIGLGGGAIFGFIAGKFKISVYRAITGLMIIVFIIPAFILVLLMITISTSEDWYLLNVSIIGILLIPSFTRVIANATTQESDFKKIGKVAISYIPLKVGLAILIYVPLGFLGFSNEHLLPQFSFYIVEARAQLFAGNPWFVFWPGFAIFMILIGFFFLHEGLKDQIR